MDSAGGVRTTERPPWLSTRRAGIHASPRAGIVPRALRAATLGVLVADATYVGADALDTVAPVTGEFVSDRPATVLDIYARAFGGAATTVVANAALLAWASAGLSVWVAMRVTCGPLL